MRFISTVCDTQITPGCALPIKLVLLRSSMGLLSSYKRKSRFLNGDQHVSEMLYLLTKRFGWSQAYYIQCPKSNYTKCLFSEMAHLIVPFIGWMFYECTFISESRMYLLGKYFKIFQKPVDRGKLVPMK